MTDDNQKALALYREMINGLHAKWRPHPGQVTIGKALIQEQIKDIFVQAGRNFGKTELCAYLLWRWAISNPGSENYYFTPFFKQSKEIVWATGRLQTFGPREWLNGTPNNSELRLTFNNGAFIKCDGSDNFEAYRGVKPRGLTVLDEFKDFRPEFYDAYDPNRVAYDAPMLIIGTPPDRECQFTHLADYYDKSPDKRFYWAPTEQNPHIPRHWLEKKKAELYAKGEGDKWEREYMARFVKGGAAKIFPMLNEQMVVPHETLMKKIERDKRKLEWYLWADPAAATCFATLFVAINPYTKDIYVIDEIYETTQSAMSVRQIGRTILTKREQIFDRKEWRQGYDEAETWFANEMLDHFDEYFEPSHKAQNDKESGLSITKDIMLKGRIQISDKCQKFYWELDNYFKDKNGRIPKANDHLIDCFRYILGAASYRLTESVEYVESKDEDFRGARLEDEFPNYDRWGLPKDQWENE